MEALNIGGHGNNLVNPSVPSSTLQNDIVIGIKAILSRWSGLQMAVENRWGGHDSLQKSHQLADEIFSWFSQSQAPLYVEDVENLLNESMLFSFNTDIEDGSIEEVAEQLMILHEEHLHENYEYEGKNPN